MATTAELKITGSFADDSTRDLKFPINPATTAATIKTRIQNFNPATIQSVYLSEGGASYTGITAATIFEVTENDINLNVSE